MQLVETGPAWLAIWAEQTSPFPTAKWLSPKRQTVQILSSSGASTNALRVQHENTFEVHPWLYVYEDNHGRLVTAVGFA